MWPQRAALELRVELAADKERVVPKLGYLDEPSVGGGAGEDHPRVGEGVPVAVVDLVAVAVALVDVVLVIHAGRERPRLDLAGVAAEAHGPAHLHADLVGHYVYDRVRALGVEFGRVGPVQADHVAGELDHGYLHPQAKAEVRRPLLSRVPGRLYLPVGATVPEP